jgi:hypothetical protein
MPDHSFKPHPASLGPVDTQVSEISNRRNAISYGKGRIGVLVFQNAAPLRIPEIKIEVIDKGHLPAPLRVGMQGFPSALSSAMISTQQAWFRPLCRNLNLRYLRAYGQMTL